MAARGATTQALRLTRQSAGGVRPFSGLVTRSAGQVAGISSSRGSSSSSSAVQWWSAGLRPGVQSGARGISSTRAVLHGDDSEFDGAPTVHINWRNKHGDVKTVDAPVGMNLMRVAHKHGIELEGACEGVCACSTCHVILEEGVYDALPEASEDEEDMLDQAFGLTATSRLGCQVVVTQDMEGITVTLPAATRNFYVDGHVPQPH